MKLHELKPAKGAKKKSKRVGRGNGSGHGTFSGKGSKGQNARSGGGVRPGFEGGQTPLLRRTPKLKGFNNINNITYHPINLNKINESYSDNETVSPETLYQKKIIAKKITQIKILSTGDLSKTLTFDKLYFSQAAQEKIISSGSKIENNLNQKKTDKTVKKSKKK